MRRWRGLADLVQDAIDQGSRAVEEIHGRAGRWVFDLLEKVPPLAPPARLARALQQAVIARAYGTIRLVNRAVGGIVAIAIHAAETTNAHRRGRASAGPPSPPASAGGEGRGEGAATRDSARRRSPRRGKRAARRSGSR